MIEENFLLFNTDDQEYYLKSFDQAKNLVRNNKGHRVNEEKLFSMYSLDLEISYESPAVATKEQICIKKIEFKDLTIEAQSNKFPLSEIGDNVPVNKIPKFNPEPDPYRNCQDLMDKNFKNLEEIKRALLVFQSTAASLNSPTLHSISGDISSNIHISDDDFELLSSLLDQNNLDILNNNDI